jgi:hypothetical protein
MNYFTMLFDILPGIFEGRRIEEIPKGQVASIEILINY